MNKLILSSLSCSIFLLTACGGGSNDNKSDNGASSDTGGGNDNSGSDNNGGSDDSNNVNGVKPVVNLTIQDTFSYTPTNTNRQVTTKIESGFDGDVQITRETYNLGGFSITSHNIQLSNNTPSLNVVDIQKTLTLDITCDNGLDIKGTQDFDFSSGEVVTNGTYNGTPYNCTDSFQTPLPLTVTSSTIENFLEDWGDDNTDQSLVSTTCPSDADDDETDVFDPTKYVCSGEILTNYVITTSDPSKVHKLSLRYELK